MNKHIDDLVEYLRINLPVDGFVKYIDNMVSRKGTLKRDIFIISEVKKEGYVRLIRDIGVEYKNKYFNKNALLRVVLRYDIKENDIIDFSMKELGVG